MIRYSEEILDEIRNRIDIIAIISEYVPLKKSGKSYKGLCPFHQEKTPSFMVDSERQIFHCFGCGEGGNIFTFIMKMEKVNFPEAVKLLANKAGVQLPVNDKQNIKNVQEKELIFQLNDLAADYYHKNLFLPQGKRALDYLMKRSFSKDIIKKFRLGYALPGFEHLVKILYSKKIPQTDLFKAGLVSRSNKTGKAIDYFRDRIIFPIFNLQGKLIAFGGRVLDDKLPKYINSPETLVYNKAKNLYGLFQAKKSIRQKNQVIIVEGYTDLLMAHQHGFENVVASLGTALTNQQIDLVKRFADEILIAFDADTAGKSATLRSLSMIKKAGMNIRIVTLPPESDPADILLKKDKIFFIDLLKKALPLIDYKLEVLLQQYNPTSSGGKLSIIKELFQDLSDINSDIELRNEVKKIAERLDLTEESIFKDLIQYKKGNRQLANILTNTSVESTHVNAEKILIGTMLQRRDYIERIFSELQVKDFTISEHKEIVSTIMNLFDKGEKISLQKVMDKIEKPDIISLISRIMLRDVISLDTGAIERSIKAIKTNKLKLELGRIKGAIQEEEKRNKEVTPELLQEYQEIMHKIKTMA
ncbi:MAG: DNA primase [Atribacterota bacterium]|nr:DNA primase [Atribacterota bacterium]MDD4895517.1 DNA primase [Atribacterota bacterium]MDD5637711.1 DNA primase [Atribacterota bacterium]